MLVLKIVIRPCLWSLEELADFPDLSIAYYNVVSHHHHPIFSFSVKLLGPPFAPGIREPVPQNNVLLVWTYPMSPLGACSHWPR